MTDSVPTGRELDLLKILWDRGSATVRDIYDVLGSRDTQLAYTTVLTLLQNMERKGLVAHQQQGKAYVYRAAAEREKTLSDLARTFLDQVFDGAVGEYVVRALESRPTNAQELEELERMIAQHRRDQDSRGGDSPQPRQAP